VATRTLNPEITQWIRQMGDGDQVVAYHAYQCLLEQVHLAGAPGKAEEQKLLASALGEALTARAGEGGKKPSVAGNPFLTAAASRTVEYRHPARVRANLARLLGYLPHEAAVPYLKQALEDLEARGMARCSLEGFGSDAALEALTGALGAAGTTFRIGVLNSLAKRGGPRVAAALRRAAEDPHEEVRLAALEALADQPDPAHDAILGKATRGGSQRERRRAHVLRIRLAAALQSQGDRAAAARIYRAVLESDAPQPQKKAARLALEV